MEEMYRRHGSRLCFCRCLVPYVPFSLRSPRVTPILVPLVRYERRENLPLLGASLLVMNGKRRSRMERDTRREVTERNGRCRKLRGERTLS